MPSYEISEKGFEILLGRAEADIDLKHRMLQSFHQELTEKDAEIAKFKAEIATLKAQLAACTQDRDREPIR